MGALRPAAKMKDVVRVWFLLLRYYDQVRPILIVLAVQGEPMVPTTAAAAAAGGPTAREMVSRIFTMLWAPSPAGNVLGAIC
jgi:hypothetical protein